MVSAGRHSHGMVALTRQQTTARSRRVVVRRRHRGRMGQPPFALAWTCSAALRRLRSLHRELALKSHHSAPALDDQCAPACYITAAAAAAAAAAAGYIDGLGGRVEQRLQPLLQLGALERRRLLGGLQGLLQPVDLRLHLGDALRSSSGLRARGQCAA